MIRRLSARAFEAEHRIHAASFLVFLALVLTLVVPYFEATRNANELPRLVQGMSLVELGSFAIDGPVRRGLELGPDVSRSPVDGRLYPNKPPGTSFVVAVAYALARALHGDALDLRTYTFWARILSGAVPTLVLAAVLVRRLARAFDRGPAIAAVALYVLATPAYAYAHLAYGHQLAACLLFVGVVACIDGVTRRHGGSRDLAVAFGGGGLAGAAVGVEYGTVFAGVPLAVLLVWKAVRRPEARAPAVASLLGAALPVAALAGYQALVFGSPFATSYHHVITPAFAAKHARGLLGLVGPDPHAAYVHLLSPDGGLLFWAPLVPFAIYGLACAATHPEEPVRSEARVSLAVLVIYLGIAASLGFEGGWRVGPRYLVAVLPFLALGLAEVLGQIRQRALWIVPVVALSTYALVLDALAANLWPHFDLDPIHHPLPEVLLPLWHRGLSPHGVLAWTLGLEASRLVVVGAVAGGLLALAHAIEPRTKTIVAFVLGLGLGAALLAGVEAWPRHPRGARNLEYIVRTWEPHGVHEPAPSRKLPELTAGELERARRGPVRRP